uniref:Immunoglobulin V-set domain-containing protein n=1 Tax=Labrus bergylta TaxID=56723 RepID=A0A3Q3EE93_9LABR
MNLYRVHSDQPTNQPVIVYSLEGSTVTLSYSYPELSTNDYFFWYRQHPGKQPQLLVGHSASGTIGNALRSGLKISVEKKEINMNISSAALTDSAVYYCALKPTKTTQHSQHPPEGVTYYKLDSVRRLWKNVDQLTGKARSKSRPIELKLNGVIQDDSLAVANGFNEYFLESVLEWGAIPMNSSYPLF